MKITKVMFIGLISLLCSINSLYLNLGNKTNTSKKDYAIDKEKKWKKN